MRISRSISRISTMLLFKIKAPGDWGFTAFKVNEKLFELLSGEQISRSALNGFNFVN